jgi:hypothetical protein
MIDRKLLPVLISLGFGAPLSGVAAEQSHPCSAIDDASQRLACYDAAFGRPAAATTVSITPAPALAPAATATATATAAVDPVAQQRAEFGLSDAAKKARDPQQSTQAESITDTLAELGQRPTGELVFNLQNGQVWLQIEADTRTRVKAGDTVTIRKGALGSFLLVGPDRVSVRVRRAR